MRNSRAFTISVYGKPNFKIENSVTTESPKTYFEWSDRQRVLSHVANFDGNFFRLVEDSIKKYLDKDNQDTFPKN